MQKNKRGTLQISSVKESVSAWRASLTNHVLKSSLERRLCEVREDLSSRIQGGSQVGCNLPEHDGLVFLACLCCTDVRLHAVSIQELKRDKKELYIQLPLLIHCSEIVK